MPRGPRDAVTIVSDDVAWTRALYAALGERGIGAVPMSSLLLDDTLPRLGVLLLDEALEPHPGSEVGTELRALLGDACPPLLLAHPEPARLAGEGVFAAVLVRSHDAAQVATDVAQALARMPAISGVVLRSRLARERSAR